MGSGYKRKKEELKTVPSNIDARLRMRLFVKKFSVFLKIFSKIKNY